MARKGIPKKISPYVWGNLVLLEAQGVPIREAYLFGSWAKGTQHRHSDIDICIVSRQFRNWEKKVIALGSARYDDLLQIEPHGYHPSEFLNDNPVAQEIRRTGIRIQ